MVLFRTICDPLHGTTAAAEFSLGGAVHGGRGVLHVPRVAGYRRLAGCANAPGPHGVPSSSRRSTWRLPSATVRKAGMSSSNARLLRT